MTIKCVWCAQEYHGLPRDVDRLMAKHVTKCRNRPRAAS